MGANVQLWVWFSYPENHFSFMRKPLYFVKVVCLYNLEFMLVTVASESKVKSRFQANVIFSHPP